MKGIDALNILKPDLEQKKNKYCGLQRPKSDQKSSGRAHVRMYVCSPLRIETISLRATKLIEFIY